MAGSGLPFGKYYLLDRVNVGGMAEVFKAKTLGVEGFERLVAIKRILPSVAEDADFVRMFIDEAKITVLLNHANIAQTYDLGRIQDTYFIAMEYVPGRDLRSIWERLRKRGEVAPYPLSAYVAARICEGLDYAHRKKDSQGRDLSIVHRDVSPQNILVSYEGEVKLIDFGIAKAANKISRTQAGILKGKFGYMSPEQVRGLPLDRRSDLFSVGIVLYELVTGDRLFRGDSDFSILEKVRAARIVPPTKVNKGVPAALERIILKALARDAEARYGWASEMQADLARYLLQATDPPFSRQDLAAFMKRTYGKEIEEADRGGHTVTAPQPKAPPHRDLAAPVPPPVAESALPSRPETAPPPPLPPPPPLAAFLDDEPTPTPNRPTELVSAKAIFRDLVTTQPMRTVAPEDRARVKSVSDAETAVGRRPYARPAEQAPDATTGPAVRMGGAAAEVTAATRPAPSRRARAARGAGLAAVGAAAAMAAYYVVAVPAPAPEAAAPAAVLPAPTTGELIVVADPTDAEILIDQRIEKPADDPRFFSNAAFPAGRHQITVRRKGYAEETRTVELAPGERVIRQFRLEPLEAELIVRTNPPGAALALEGLDRAERTPARVGGLKATGTYTVLLRKPPCWAPVEMTVQMDGDARRDLIVDLQPVPGACPQRQRSAVSDQPSTVGGQPSAKATAPAASGWLRVTSKPPGARVFVNNADAGTTPVLKLAVPAGPTRIRIVAKDGRSEEATVVVRANEVYTHIARF